MKQVLIRKGNVVVEDVPAPGIDARSILVQVHFSCISVGTERAGVELSGLPLYRRALRQPHHARRALEVARDQGFVSTYKRIAGQLAAGTPTGYSAAGVVVAVGDDVTGFALGDRVACAGAGIANHAELIAVPVNLATRVPDGISLHDASTVTLGAIALQGVRRLGPTLGETVGVVGLGVLGQLTVQLLHANGCRVVASDPDPARRELASRSGARWVTAPGTEFVETAHRASDGHGIDGVVITASTPSDEPVSDAFRACRRKGRVVLVGDVGLKLRRHEMYEKELDFRISTSYGPGRYDDVYESEGQDYPLPYVRWTEGRNFDEYLRLLAEGRVTLDSFPTEAFPAAEAPRAFDALAGEGEKPLLAILEYPHDEPAFERTVRLRSTPGLTGRIGVAIVGAGSFAAATHAPNLVALRDRFHVRGVVSRTGPSAKALAQRLSAAYATTDLDEALSDDQVDLVLIATRHDLHVPFALRALEAGKHVFVEKPLAIDEEDLESILSFYEERDAPMLLTGFNRRFSPAIAHLRSALAGRTSPLVVSYRMNAGYVPPDSWLHGPEGGGRNIGEASHVYDVFDALTGAEYTSVAAVAIDPQSEHWRRNDNFTATISYTDGSVCTLTYTALGHREHPKEEMEVFADGAVWSLRDYKSLTVAGRKAGGWSSRSADKGHRRQLQALADALARGGAWPVSLEEQVRATRISFEVERQIS